MGGRVSALRSAALRTNYEYWRAPDHRAQVLIRVHMASVLILSPVSTIYCFGCGTDLTSTPTERRSLTSEYNAHVAQVWKAFVVDEP